MRYYFVGGSSITVMNKNKSLINLTKKEVLSSLPFLPEKAKKHQAYVLFDDYDVAAKFALLGTTKEDPEQFPIFEVVLKNPRSIQEVKIDKDGTIIDEDESKDLENVFDAFETDARNVIFVKASLKYINDDFDDIILRNPKVETAFKKDAEIELPRNLTELVNILQEHFTNANDVAVEGDNLGKDQPKVLPQLEISRNEALLKDGAAKTDEKPVEKSSDLEKKKPEFTKP